jgi:hypothetical protein
VFDFPDPDLPVTNPRPASTSITGSETPSPTVIASGTSLISGCVGGFRVWALWLDGGLGGSSRGDSPSDGGVTPARESGCGLQEPSR